MYSLTLWTALLRIFCAAAAGFVIGLDRLYSGRVAGIRTHIIIAIGSALAMIAGIYCGQTLGMDADVTRIASGVVSGIGFLGVGIIFVRGQKNVTGLTTAAGLWTTGIIGIGYGAGLFLVSTFTALLLLAAMIVFRRYALRVRRKQQDTDLYAELDDVCAVSGFQEDVYGIAGLHSLSVTPPRSGQPRNVGIEIDAKDVADRKEFMDRIRQLPHVVFVLQDHTG